MWWKPAGFRNIADMYNVEGVRKLHYNMPNYTTHAKLHYTCQIRNATTLHMPAMSWKPAGFRDIAGMYLSLIHI